MSKHNRSRLASFSQSLLLLAACSVALPACLGLEEVEGEEHSDRKANASGQKDNQKDKAALQKSNELRGTFYDVTVAGDTIYTSKLQYKPDELITLDPEGEDVSKLLDMYAPMECESCTCSGGTCLCEGCSIKETI